MNKKAYELANLVVNELSLVKRGANQEAHVVLYKHEQKNDASIKNENSKDEGFTMSLEKILEGVTKAINPVVEQVSSMQAKLEDLEKKSKMPMVDEDEEAAKKKKPEQKAEDKEVIEDNIGKSVEDAISEIKKQYQESIEQVNKQLEDLKKQKEEFEIQKSVESQFPYLPGTLEQKVDLFKKLSGDEYGQSILKQLNDKTQSVLGKSVGHSQPGTNVGTSQDRLDTLVKEYAEKHNVSLVKAEAAVLDTAEGAKLYAEVERGL